MIILPPVQQETLEFLLQLGGKATTSDIAETFQVKMHRVNHALTMLLEKGILERRKLDGAYIYNVRDGWEQQVQVAEEASKESVCDAFFTNTMRRCVTALKDGKATFHELIERTNLPALSIKEDLEALETGHFIRQDGDEWRLTGKIIPSPLDTDAGLLAQMAQPKTTALWACSLPVCSLKRKVH